MREKASVWCGGGTQEAGVRTVRGMVGRDNKVGRFGQSLNWARPKGGRKERERGRGARNVGGHEEEDLGA